LALKRKGATARLRQSATGAFTMPWSARQRYRRDQRPTEVPFHEMVCAENNGDHFNQGPIQSHRQASQIFERSVGNSTTPVTFWVDNNHHDK
jgi:hypothetical protein